MPPAPLTASAILSLPCLVFLSTLPPTPQVWSTTTGLLQATCRGHDAEITDLSVSADNALVASSSMDGTVRVWQLEVGPQQAGGRCRPHEGCLDVVLAAGL